VALPYCFPKDYGKRIGMTKTSSLPVLTGYEVRTSVQRRIICHRSTLYIPVEGSWLETIGFGFATPVLLHADRSDIRLTVIHPFDRADRLIREM
jgi:hypothetical protein